MSLGANKEKLGFIEKWASFLNWFIQGKILFWSITFWCIIPQEAHLWITGTQWCSDFKYRGLLATWHSPSPLQKHSTWRKHTFFIFNFWRDTVSLTKLWDHTHSCTCVLSRFFFVFPSLFCPRERKLVNERRRAISRVCGWPSRAGCLGRCGSLNKWVLMSWSCS